MTKIMTIFLVFSGLTMVSQNINSILQSAKWYATSKGKTIIYSKKTTDKNPVSYEFKPGGKVIHCAETMESSLDASGKEITTSGYRCDSVWTYEVKNNMLQTRLLKQTPDHYKLTIKGDIIELNPVKAEEYNK